MAQKALRSSTVEVIDLGSSDNSSDEQGDGDDDDQDFTFELEEVGRRAQGDRQDNMPPTTQPPQAASVVLQTLVKEPDNGALPYRPTELASAHLNIQSAMPPRPTPHPERVRLNCRNDIENSSLAQRQKRQARHNHDQAVLQIKYREASAKLRNNHAQEALLVHSRDVCAQLEQKFYAEMNGILLAREKTVAQVNADFANDPVAAVNKYWRPMEMPVGDRIVQRVKFAGGMGPPNSTSTTTPQGNNEISLASSSSSTIGDQHVPANGPQSFSMKPSSTTPIPSAPFPTAAVRRDRNTRIVGWRDASGTAPQTPQQYPLHQLKPLRMPRDISTAAMQTRPPTHPGPTQPGLWDFIQEDPSSAGASARIEDPSPEGSKKRRRRNMTEE